jgi:hypothetical protein
MERPPGVSSANEDNCAASASSDSGTPGAGMKRAARHCQHVVLDKAVHAGDADGRQQSTIVVGIRQTKRETRTNIVSGEREYMAKGCKVTTASRKMIVNPASRMLSAISVGVFWRSAPSTSAIMRSRNVSPGFEVISTLI